MFEAILMAKFTTIIFVCIMSFLIGIMVGITERRDRSNMRPTEEFVNDFMQRVEEGKYDRPDPGSMISQEEANALLSEQEEAPERPVESYHEVDPTFTKGKKPSLKQIKEYIVDMLREEYERGYRDGKAEREVIEDDLK